MVRKQAGSDAESIEAVRDAAAGCRACDLWKLGTQTVFGEGRSRADVMLVGEQPGDEEDRQGRPFVGPAGRELHRALEQAGLDPERIYVTNAVKHFKWEPRGKRRLHMKPRLSEVLACHPWLEDEVRLVRPRVVVALGTTAARALLGRPVTIASVRGEPQPSALGPAVIVTVHPSSILRTPDEASRHAARGEFVRDLERVAALLQP